MYANASASATHCLEPKVPKHVAAPDLPKLWGEVYAQSSEKLVKPASAGCRTACSVVQGPPVLIGA